MSGLSAGIAPGEFRTWVTKADRAHGVIRKAILSGRLAPKESINPKQIAEELGMSIIPVREALRRLEQEDLVVIRPHIGAAVREMPLAEIMENLLIRSALESLAAELAAPLMTTATIETLYDFMTRMNACLAREQYDEFAELNRQFHLGIYSAISEKRLVRLIEKQWDRSPRGASVFSIVPEHAMTTQKEHALIVAALERRDGVAAAKHTRAHKLRTRDAHVLAFAADVEEELKAAV